MAGHHQRNTLQGKTSRNSRPPPHRPQRGRPAAWAAGSWSAIPNTTLPGSAAKLTEHLTAIAEQGITEIVYQPSGPDIPYGRGFEPRPPDVRSYFSAGTESSFIHRFWKPCRRGGRRPACEHDHATCSGPGVWHG